MIKTIVRKYLSPLWERVAKIERSEIETGEGSLSADADPSSAHDTSYRGHLLPQGEREADPE
jgi:hypothetical protein